MKFIKTYEKFNNKDILLIVDVQESFNKYFTPKYLEELKKHCKNFSKVYQIWDNHHLGKNPDKDYLYDDEPESESKSNLYDFPNQVDVIEKRYTYDVDADFFEKVLDEKTYDEIKSKESELKKGEYYPTTEGTIIVFIGNKHQWFHVPKKLYEIFTELRQAQTDNVNIEIVGGAMGECLEDIITTARSLGLDIIENRDYIWSADNCPIS
jgi:hypothetical protein